MVWTSYSIDPLDTLFFRDGRPFAAGEGSNVSTLFPPTPFTLQGMVRSALLSKGCGRGVSTYKEGCERGACPDRDECRVKPVVGSLDGSYPGTLRIRGPWLLVNGEPILPAPADLIGRTEDKKKVFLDKQPCLSTGLLRPGEEKSSNLPGALKSLVPPSEGWEAFETAGGWLTWPAYRRYLSGAPPILVRRENWWLESDLWESELRPGLEIESGKARSKEGMLYFARHIRLKPSVRIGFAVDGVEGEGFTDFIAYPLGGERRAIRLERLQDGLPWGDTPDGTIGAAVRENRSIKLVLAQMSWFENGWKPEGWDDANGSAKINGAEPAWLAACLNRPEQIGGWDLARSDQKPVRRFVPRGSVYYLRANDDSSARAALALWSECFSETPRSPSPKDGFPAEPFAYKAMGLGYCFIGTW